MSETMKDITAVLMAVIGVAVVAVLVSNESNTSAVISNASSGFGNILAVAMGGAAGRASFNGA